VLERLAGSHRRDQALGCVLLALGLGGVVAAAPAGSIALLIGGSIVAGIAHGIAFLTAQQELNERAPDERRGEVTAAFIACIYFLVASFVIASGLLGSVFSLDSSVEAVGSVLIVLALGVAPGTPLLGALPLPGIEQLLHVPSLLVAELEAREEAPGLGHVVVLDRGLEVLPGRDRLPQLAPQPAEEAYLRGFHAASVAALAGRYRSAARRTISAACSLESWSVLTTRS